MDNQVEKTSFKQKLLNFLLYLGITLFVIALFKYVIGITTVLGPSMEPTYLNGETLYISKMYYRFHDVSRRDVIAFYDENGMMYVKRVIGLPNENIEVKDNILYIDGDIKSEDYLGDIKTDDFKLKDVCDICVDAKIPDGYYFVMGDNRPGSVDSRNPVFGLASKDLIIGKIKFRIFPIKRK